MELGASAGGAGWLGILGTVSRETLRSYATAWRAWTGFLAGQGRTPAAATAADVQAWADQLRRAGRRPATIQARVAACRAVAARLDGETKGIFTLDLASGGRGSGPRPPRGRIPRLTPAQARRLLGAIDRQTVAGARDYALLSLLLATNARASQALRLRVGDIRPLPDGRAVVALDGLVRHVAPWVWQAVQAYLELTARTDAAAEPLWAPLPGWPRAAGGPIGVAQVNNILRRRLEAAGIAIPEQYSTGSLRGLWLGAG